MRHLNDKPGSPRLALRHGLKLSIVFRLTLIALPGGAGLSARWFTKEAGRP